MNEDSSLVAQIVSDVLIYRAVSCWCVDKRVI